MKIEVGKRYKNRMGDECKVIHRLEGGYTFPFVVIIKEKYGAERREDFTENGDYRDYGISSLWDLCEEIPERLKTAKETKAAEEPEESAPGQSFGSEILSSCGNLNICGEDVQAAYAHIKHPKEIYMRDKFTERHKEPLQMNADGSVKGWAPAEMRAENEAKGWRAFVPEGDTLRADKFANIVKECSAEAEKFAEALREMSELIEPSFRVHWSEKESLIKVVITSRDDSRIENIFTISKDSALRLSLDILSAVSDINEGIEDKEWRKLYVDLPDAEELLRKAKKEWGIPK